ncbi:hypothetical protein DNTS_007586 [Danionella cerebrum]|uniref:Anillin n=1 Tax=Danionella cerebrum TaxID=2873325 RepID=A0A553REY2_9TELE|nr:hypothetical protein DNTS_007586 [Danionella translucida]
MDPFTEKLLERTRARRENLQRKMAERPTAVNRTMAKRTREPLTDTNSSISEPIIEKALPSSKPSPSKRRCSDENALLNEEENMQPMQSQQTIAVPITDKKPPIMPSSVRPVAIQQRLAPEHLSNQLLTDTEKVVVCPSRSPAKSTESLLRHCMPEEAKESQKDASTTFASSMKSRLQRLAEQRQNWDSESTLETGPETAVISPLKSQKVNLPAATPTNETPAGRKGRFANLAATIGSWEDDFGRPPTRHDNARTQPGTACVRPPDSTGSNWEKARSAQPAPHKSAESRQQPTVYSPAKSTRVIPPSPQKTEMPQPKLVQVAPSVSSLLKTYPSTQPSSPLKSVPGSPSSPQRSYTTQSPLKNQITPNAYKSGAPLNSSPAKPNLLPKPNVEVIPQSHERFTKDSAPVGPSGGVKSFLERFGERCQERSQNSSSVVGGPEIISASTAATPKSRLLLERLGGAQTTSATAALTQKQKMEREAELAQIRNRFQKGTVFRSKEDLSDARNDPENKDSGISSPAKKIELPIELPVENEEEVREIEMNVDTSVNSEVINELFDGVLEESEEDTEDDALNISSMSILAPLAEKVAAVVKSPERKPMTSTPASSFTEKAATPESVSRPTKFQRTRMLQVESSDIDNLSEPQNLFYSIDAYRSTRVKPESDRPHVKQVIVRKEDISQRMEMNGSSSHTNIKLKMKVSERRAALKAELDRLKAEGPTQKKGTSRAQEEMGVTASKGSISLLELRLPLKADFICSSANKPECGSHYFFVMIRAGAENTVATPLSSTRTGLSGDALTFTTKFTLSDVTNDFEIDIEVYCLVQKRELNSEKKKKASKTKAITPKRFLAISKSNMQTPVVASPGGPNAVRTSSFVLVGSHKLTLASIGQSRFLLEKIKYERSERELLSDMFHHKVPFLCPLEGHVYLKMQCEVGSRIEERGFLTMFEDVSGFGAWHRRWCVLSGYCISYWTYPDDEKRKNPIGRINLANCTSRKVEPANREFCARPNTFELITVRPQRDDDRETLVSQCKDTLCVTKNWLSADTKDERNLWMQKLNQILVDLRMWQPDTCYKPM